ncbi:MAG: glycosyltransferase [Clostridia bacterium]|nr:glycosyltransferase [Clostridia bacterium]
MRLMIVTHNMAGGGTERVIARLLRYFVRAGDSCTLVTECAGPSFYALPEAVERLSLLEGPHIGYRYLPRAYLRLRRLVKARRPDMVLAMPEKVNVWTVLSLMGTGVPVVVSERNDPKRHPENRLKRLLRRLVYPMAAGFIFQTDMAAACFPARIRARGAVLDNPLDTSRMPPANTGARGRTVVGAGRLEPQKNFSLLIEAFARFFAAHPDWRLVIYGEGRERGALEARARALLPPDAWSMPGQTEALDAALLQAGMFVLSSDFEGMPNALIEAMALGAPCVAADCRAGGPAALIRDGENGLLTPAGDPAAMAAAMARAADDAPLRRQLSRNAEQIRLRLDEALVCGQWRSYLGKHIRG